MITRTFTRDELEELDLPWDEDLVVSNEYVGDKRWATVHECVFRTEEDGPLWRVIYYKPASESQECDPWGYGSEPDTVEAVQVEPYEVTVTKYRPIAA